MDFHKAVNATLEDLKKTHLADLSVQEKYGVIYHQFWVNEEEGSVFCLVEGPDKEACKAAHVAAHGLLPCSITEVEPEFYALFMGNDHVVDEGLVRRSNHTADPATRFILITNFRTVKTDRQKRKPPAGIDDRVKDLSLTILSRFHGREVSWLPDDSIVAVFDSAANALRCALQMQAALQHGKGEGATLGFNVSVRMGLSAGLPLTEGTDFFAEATTLACRLCSIARPGELLISTKIQECCNVREIARRANPAAEFRVLTSREEEFIFRMYAIAEEKLAEENFTVDHLCRNIGMSRPQLYRKTVALTGKSPNDFIRDLRMQKALALIRKKAGNIAEIALEVGYNNPSYFAKCFQLRYGCPPSRFAG